MNRRLYTSSLLNAFGKGRRPVYAAGLKLSLLLAAAAGGSLLLYRQVASLPLTPFGRPVFLFAALLSAAHGTVSLTLLASSGALRSAAQDHYARLVSYWPLKPAERWLAMILPTLCISLVAMVIVVPALAVIFSRLGLATPLMVLGISAGMASGTGAAWCVTTPWQLIVIPAVLTGSYKAVTGLRAQPDLWLLTSLILLHGLLIAALPRVGKPYVTRPPHILAVHTSWLSHRWWLAKVLWRSPRMRLSLITSLMLSGGTAVFMARTSALTIETAVMVLAVLAAAAAADIRSIAPCERPPHSVALRGSAYFIRGSLSLTLLLASLATLPLLLVILHRHGAAGTAVTHLLLGMSAGYFACHMIAPAPRDLSAQCVATFMAIAILMAVNRLLAQTAMEAPPGLLLRSTVALCLLWAAYRAERQRNPYLWRK